MKHPPQLLPYRELSLRPSASALRAAVFPRESEVPSGYAVSLALPTRRWFGPGFAYFASPATRRPGEPVQQKSPDRWWVVDAHTGRVIAYALVAAIPFHEGLPWGDVQWTASSASIPQQRDAYERLAIVIDRIAPFFFRGETLPSAERKALTDVLAELIPAALMVQYRALVPDFFSWLEA